MGTRAAHPFMPESIGTPVVLRWLKRTHAWVGILTAMLALVFAWSGFMLNHRTHFTLGAEARTVEFTIAAPATGFASPQELADYLDAEFGLRTRPTLAGGGASPQPAGMGQSRAAAAQAEAAQAMGAMSAMGAGRRGGGNAPGPSFAARWQAPGGDFSGEWIVGASEIAIAQSDRGFNRVANRLHAGRGTDGRWHVLITAYAVMLLFLTLSGVMLWSRASGPAKLGGSLLGGALLLIGAWILIGP